MKNIFVKNVSYKDLVLIASNISKLYEENIPFFYIFELLDELPLRKDYKESLISMVNVIKEGGNLEKCFATKKELFPNFFISMVGIGEHTGKMGKVLNGLSLYYEKINIVHEKVISSLSYPIMLLASLFILFNFVIFYFIPKMSSIYIELGRGIPNIYVKINEVINFASENMLISLFYIVFWIILIPCFVYKFYLEAYIKALIFKMQIYKMFNEYISIMLMSVIVNSGITISLGISKCCECEAINSVVSENMLIINNNIIRGKTLKESMEKSNIFSRYTLAHIRLGEEGGSIDKTLIVIEKELFNKLMSKIDKTLELIQPALIVFMATIVLIFLLVFIMPLFDNMLIG